MDSNLQAWLERQTFKAPILVMSWVVWFCTSISGMAALQFDVFPGYGDVMRSYHWCPFTFEMHHDGPGFSGFILLRDANNGVEHSIPI